LSAVRWSISTVSNARALSAYRRCGFEVGGDRTGSEHGTDLVMRLPVA
jgi:hypothetical protein